MTNSPDQAEKSANKSIEDDDIEVEDNEDHEANKEDDTQMSSTDKEEARDDFKKLVAEITIRFKEAQAARHAKGEKQKKKEKLKNQEKQKKK